MTDVWSGRAEAYRAAADQREGEDLELLAEWAAEAGHAALDVASGGGHTARMLRSLGFEVATLDPAPGMGADVLAPAEDIPFADGSFDLVACRIAPHHFADVEAAVREMARVSRKVVVIEDTLFVSEAVERAERLRDPSHVRSYTEAQWRGFLNAAGLEVEEVRVLAKRRSVEMWLARTATPPEDAAEVRRLLEPFIVDEEYVDRKILLKARKR